MERQVRKDSKVMWVLKALLASYIVTGILLLLLTMALYKMELNEKMVSAGDRSYLCHGDLDRRNSDRQDGQSEAVHMGPWSWRRVFCPASADHAGGVPYAERRRRQSRDHIYLMRGRRNGRRNDIVKETDTSKKCLSLLA